MRIGAFSAMTGVTPDALRHYMALGLLVVKKMGGQYDFDDQVRGDLQRLLQLKGMGFSLAEIQVLFRFERLGVMTDYQKELHYQDIFNRRIETVRQELQRLQASLTALEAAARVLPGEEVLQRSEARHLVGLPLSAVGLMICRHCGENLTLNEGEVRKGQIVQGRLSCQRGCGDAFDLRIEDGIVYGKSGKLREALGGSAAPESQTPVPRLALGGNQEEAFLQAYLNATDPAYLDRIYEGLNWMRDRADFSGCQTALELGSGHGFYLRTVYGTLPEALLYVAVDHDPERHRFLKKILEGAGAPRNVVLICCDFREIPLKPESFDALLDFTGSSNFNFEAADSLPALVDPLVKARARIFGSYIVFERFGVNTRISPDRRNRFTEAGVIDSLKSQGFEMTEIYSTRSVGRGGVYEDFFDEDERVKTLMVVGCRDHRPTGK